jgi:sigma-B regulation protein RsbU (phosphoserine phosphatase)
LNVTVAERTAEAKGASERTLTIPLARAEIPERTWIGVAVTLAFVVLLPLFPVAVGFWVAAVRPRDKLAWVVLALMVAFGCLDNGQQASWGPWLRDFGVAFAKLTRSTLLLWFLLFAVYFPEPFPAESRWAKWMRMKWVLIVPWVLFALANVITAIGQIESYKAIQFLEHVPAVARRLETVVAITTALCAAACLAAKYYFAKSADSQRRLRWLYGSLVVIFVLAVILVAASTINSAYRQPVVNLDVGAYVAFLVFPLTLAYVILVHRAMDIRPALRQGLQYALASNGVRVIQIVITAAMLLLALRIATRSQGSLIETTMVAAVGLLAVSSVRRGAEKLRAWIDLRFFRETYDTEQVLSELSQQARNILEPLPLIESVAMRLAETLHVSRLAVLLETGSPYEPAYAIGYGGLPLVSLPQSSATVKVLVEEKQAVHVYLDDPDSWVFRTPETSEEERGKLAQLSAELLLPLAGRDKLLGFISLGPKRSEAPYSGNDLRLLMSVATQTGLALENARLMTAVADNARKLERFSRELEIAREVQERLFPQELPPIHGIDYWGTCRPALGVGGDYYDFVALPRGRLGIAIGDVSGKGIAAALMMASLQASLRGEVSRDPEDLALLISHVNRLLYHVSSSERYATFFYADYEPARRTLTYVNAGHNPPLLLRKKARPRPDCSPGWEVLRLKTGGTVVGLLESFPFEQESLELYPGDMMVAFTDGITECMNLQQEEWGEERFIAVVEQCGNMAAQETIARALEATDAFAGGATQHDDMTLVVLKVK